MKEPLVFKVTELLAYFQDLAEAATRAGKLYYEPTRPERKKHPLSFIFRLFISWKVFTGEYDALKWDHPMDKFGGKK